MHVTNATFSIPPVLLDPTCVVQVRVEGSGFRHRAMPVAARIGNVPLEFVVVNAAGTKFVGLLRTFPQIGDVLKVGYLDTELMDTTITYTTPIVT
jgi:hypothetical protein